MWSVSIVSVPQGHPAGVGPSSFTIYVASVLISVLEN